AMLLLTDGSGRNGAGRVRLRCWSLTRVLLDGSSSPDTVRWGSVRGSSCIRDGPDGQIEHVSDPPSPPTGPRELEESARPFLREREVIGVEREWRAGSGRHPPEEPIAGNKPQG